MDWGQSSEAIKFKEAEASAVLPARLRAVTHAFRGKGKHRPLAVAVAVKFSLFFPTNLLAALQAVNVRAEPFCCEMSTIREVNNVKGIQ